MKVNKVILSYEGVFEFSVAGMQICILGLGHYMTVICVRDKFKINYNDQL